MKSKLSIIAIASVVLFGAGVKLVLACADGPSPFDSYVSFFQNNVTAQPQYSPFYYTTASILNDPSYFYGDEPEDDVAPNGNIEEWVSYTKRAATRADIDSFMNTFSYNEVSALAKGKSSGKVKSNSFSRFLSQPGNSDALDYLVYAKQCEPLNAGMEQYWDNASNTYKTPVRDTGRLGQLILTGVTMSAKTSSSFLKWRYTYQAMRLAFNNDRYAATLKMYDLLIGTKTANNIMYPRCLALKAGALFHIRKKKEAAYLYSKAFDLSDDMKHNAYLSFLWCTDSISIKAVATLCKSKHEQAVLQVMDGLYERSNEETEGLGLMQKAYALDPNVKGLSIVMTREINKAEEHYLQEKESIHRGISESWWASFYTTSDADIAKRNAEWKQLKNKYLPYLNSLNTFAQKVAGDSKTKDKAFWRLASSYLYFIQDKYPDSRKYADLAGKEKMNPHEHDMMDVINMLNIVHQSDKITAETEAALLPCMKWVDAHDNKSQRFDKVYRDFLSVILTNRYMAQQDTVKAAYCLARVAKSDGGFSVSDDFTDISGGLLENMSIDQLHAVQKFVEKKDKTDFEKWLTYNTPYSDGVLKELEGTKYIREMDFEKAVKVLSGVPKSVLSKTVLPDILISHLEDSQDWNASDSAHTYNKLEFAKKMLSLESILLFNPKSGRVAYQYANGLYNMSYYGRAHHAFDYYRSAGDEDAYYTTKSRSKLPAYKKEYYNLDKALKYYLIAAKNLPEKEMKARCTFMAAKCWQKNCPIPADKDRYSYDDKNYYLNSLANPYFVKLKTDYKISHVYMDAVATCSYFEDYVTKK